MSDYSFELFTGALTVGAVCLLILLALIASSIRIIPEEKRIHVFRLGRFIGEKGPGIVLLLPLVDKGIIVDHLDQINKVQEIVHSGAIGETLTPVHNDGSVNIYGETWNAMSKTPIPIGSKVRVIGVMLEIEEIP